MLDLNIKEQVKKWEMDMLGFKECGFLIAGMNLMINLDIIFIKNLMVLEKSLNVIYIFQYEK